MDETNAPRTTPITEPAPPPERRPLEQWAAAQKVPAWLAAAAKGLRAWPDGAEVTEAEYETAVADAGAIQLGYPAR